MRGSKKRSALALLPAIAALGGILGLVRSVGRAPSESRTGMAPRARASEATVELLAPLVLPPAEEGGATERAKPVAEKLPRAPRLAGTVLRPDGSPASGARVLLGPESARCDADGAFELALSSELGAADLVVHEPGFEPVLRAAFGASLGANDAELHFVLGPPSGSLAGTVVDRAGRPLARWNVGLDGLDPLEDFGLREPVLTDAEGGFSLSDVPQGVHVVCAWRERRELAYRSSPAQTGTEGLQIVVESFE